MPGGLTVSRGPLLLTTVCAVLGTVALLPICRLQLGPSVSFVPAMLSVVACFDLLSVYLLVGDYRDRGDPRMLMMAWAYSCSLVLMGGYGLAFPGAISTNPPLSVTPSMAAYLYVAWHGGFPLLLGAAWAPWPTRWTAPTPALRRRTVASVTVTAAVLIGVVIIALLFAFAHHLPVLIVGVDISRMTTMTAPLTIPLVVLALAVAVRGSRRRTGPERWSTIAILACLGDLILTYRSGARYSLGWYCGRSLTLVSAGVVLIAMLVAFRRLKSQAEYDAAMDSLTGLHNRRSAHATLDQLVARCQRSGALLSVLSLDLDHFKQVNDQQGHETGDAVLAEVGQLLARTCRKGDTVARVGGEEFLILLADTGYQGALVVAEKVRATIAAMTVPGLDAPVTASLGATTLQHDDSAATVLRRADAALYRAKHAGRNCVVMLGPDNDDERDVTASRVMRR
jgi:diguanylate cyclase (GGDEF)-like protein